MKNLFVSKEPITKLAFFLNSMIIITFFAAMVWFALERLGIKLDFVALNTFGPRIKEGFIMTILLSVTSLVLSLTMGIVTAIASKSTVHMIRLFGNCYVKIIRGTPLIAQIYLFYYIIGTAFGVTNRFLSGVIILSVFEGAYIAEIIRGSLLSIEGSQLEVAQSVGFTKRQTLQYVIIPQLVARTLPSLTGQFASIIKDSSLLSIIAVIEITQTMREITATNFRFFEAYLLLGALYLLLTLPLSYMSEYLERKHNYALRT